MFKAFEEIMENFKGFSNMKLNEPGYAPWIRNGNTYCTIVRTVGIDPKDVSVVAENVVIKVKGATKVGGTEYSVDFNSPLSETFFSKIAAVDHETINGLTYLTVDLND